MGGMRGGVCGAGAAWRKLAPLCLTSLVLVRALVSPAARLKLVGRIPGRSPARCPVWVANAAASSESEGGVLRKSGTWLASRGAALGRRVLPPLGAQNRPLKVALLVEPTPFTHVCGYANRFKEMLRYFREFGNTEVRIATPDDKAEAPTEYCGYKVETMTGYHVPLYPELYLTGDLRGEAKRMIEGFKPDLIHVSTPGFLVLAAIAYARALKIPLVMSYHTHLPVYAEKYTGWIPFSRQSAWKYIKLLHSFADLTLVTSPQMLQEFREQGIRRVAVWRKGVDVEVFHPKHRTDAAREELTATPKNPVLLYVGRLSVEKRLEDIAAVLDRRPDASLALVGGGPHEGRLRDHFARFGDRVRFLGVKRGIDLSRLYASADLFCMPSDSETLGFVVIEAMASGLGVVAARAGGIPSIVDHDVNGILVDPAKPDAFATACDALLKDETAFNRLASRARADAESWSWEAATKHLRDVQYTAAIRRHAALQRLHKTERTFTLFPPTLRRVLRKRVTGALAFLNKRVKTLYLAPWHFITTFTTKYRIVTAY
mmetsp:Transcript_2082/g.6324  ORF Transcript_2082/g.6324 Transcript_2082/m.6324 type:complete len:544 (+) Transcript_2082:59-1690(+)